MTKIHATLRNTLLALPLTLPVALLAAPAIAGQVQGTVAQVDPAARTMVLETGEAFTLAESVEVETLVPGTPVVVTFTDGTTEATEIAPAG